MIVYPRARRFAGTGHADEEVKRSDAAKGFYVLPKRWIVERTYGWLNRPADATSNCKARGRNIKCPDGL